MKKAFKVTWISLASLVGLIIIVLLIAMYLIFSPKRLTSLVNKYASNFITCDYNFGKVDLTLFKTFPDAGVEINDVVLINPTNGWTTDTLAAIDQCVVSVNLRKILFETGNKLIKPCDNGFDENTQKSLGYYVYLLVDPNDEKPFYVGKGQNNRVFDHIQDAMDNPHDNRDKFERIRAIGAENVKHYIVAHGLSQENST